MADKKNDKEKSRVPFLSLHQKSISWFFPFLSVCGILVAIGTLREKLSEKQSVDYFEILKSLAENLFDLSIIVGFLFVAGEPVSRFFKWIIQRCLEKRKDWREKIAREIHNAIARKYNIPIDLLEDIEKTSIRVLGEKTDQNKRIALEIRDAVESISDKHRGWFETGTKGDELRFHKSIKDESFRILEKNPTPSIFDIFKRKKRK